MTKNSITKHRIDAIIKLLKSKLCLMIDNKIIEKLIN